LWGVMGWLLPAMLSCSGPQQDLPNIICIVADDLGWKDVGFMGSGYYETPHLDLPGRGRWCSIRPKRARPGKEWCSIRPMRQPPIVPLAVLA
jgi:hypothetical protein